ncbi:MAG: methionine--tRNA ligase [Gammaproteobacteria bacterium]|jgi:methionyl-tRNA synthetase
MSKSLRKILVTSALTYANGPLHLGHLVEYIQTDIWVRFQRMHGNSCIYICGSDCHGTPIMIQAEKDKITPEELVNKVNQSQIKDCQDFMIAFDNFYTTHSPENRALVEEIYTKLKTNGDITKKTIEQAYDAEKNIFLPDRYVKGECPRCGAKDQYGDNCEVCGSTYSSSELKNPISTLSGTPPITKSSEHFFFNLPNYTDKLKKWTSAGHLQNSVLHKLNEWFKQGLKEWDISRDQPYFGFEIPDAPGKYFYVWLDAPIGYMASLKNLCDKRDDLNFDEYWQKDSDTDLYHFIGKDIMYFHALFWPAVLMSAAKRTPTAIFVHGFLTINGEKMSKSRGTLISARKYLDHLAPEYLRYYFASKLSNTLEDLDLNFEDFRLKINSDLVGKVVNIASRCAGFITKHFDGKLSKECTETKLLQEFIDTGNEITRAYEHLEFSRAVRLIMLLADQANQYIDAKKPWQLIKDENTKQTAQAICSVGLNMFRLLIIYLKPILPGLAKNAEEFLNLPEQIWEDHKNILLDHKINKFKPLMQRIEASDIESILNSN